MGRHESGKTTTEILLLLKHNHGSAIHFHFSPNISQSDKMVADLYETQSSVIPSVTVESKHYVPGDIAWTLVCSALVWLMVPGVGFFYSGLARSKSALSLVSLCLWSIAVVSIQVIQNYVTTPKIMTFVS